MTTDDLCHFYVRDVQPVPADEGCLLCGGHLHAPRDLSDPRTAIDSLREVSA